MGITRSTSFLTDEMNKAHTAFMKANKSNVMTLNNQNTLLLEYQRMLVDDSVSMTKILSFILHDNRIYVFERFIPKPKDDRDLELASCTRPISQPFRPISGEIPDSSNPLHPSSAVAKNQMSLSCQVLMAQQMEPGKKWIKVKRSMIQQYQHQQRI